MPTTGQETTEGRAGTGSKPPALIAHDAEACISVQRPGGPCHACADACPASVIAISERQVTIETAECIGCGRCVAACPTEAISVAGFALADGGEVRLECVRAPSRGASGDVQTVACLGGLTSEQLRRAVADGQHVTIVDRGWCGSCLVAQDPAPWRHALAAVTTELTILERDGRTAGRNAPARLGSIRVEQSALPFDEARPPPSRRNASSEAVSRRQLFRRAVEPMAAGPPRLTATASRGTPVGRVRTTAQERRQQQLARLWAGLALPASLFPTASVAPSCCDNQICARACPTASLQVVGGDGGETLEFDAVLCLHCGACEAACPTASIEIHRRAESYYGGSIVLRRVQRAVCHRCGGDFIPNDSAPGCPACAKDEGLARLGHGLMRRRRSDVETADDVPS